MLDALLYAVRDNLIKNSGLQLSLATCQVMASGEPPPRCGKTFVAVHGDATETSSETDNKLEEYFGFTLTLTWRITLSFDRIGDQEIAVNLRKNGFNRWCENLRAYCHMAWGILQDANVNIAAWAPEGQGSVYGFNEPARYKGMSKPRLVGSDWFAAEPPEEGRDMEFGIVSDLRFEGARRFQAIAEYV